MKWHEGAGLFGYLIGSLIGWPLGLWLHATLSDPIDFSVGQESTHTWWDDWQDDLDAWRYPPGPGDRGLVGPAGEPGVDLR